MRDIDFNNEPSPARPLRRAFAAALCLSFSAHLVLLSQLHRPAPSTSVSATPRSITLALTTTMTPAPTSPPDRLATAPDPQVATSEPATPADSEAIDDTRAQDIPVTTTPQLAPAPPAEPIPVIDRDALRAIAAEATEEGPKPQSVNGGTVADPRLAARLAQLREGKAPVASTASDIPGANFDGNSWSEFVRMGSRCFRVVAADPLTPGSQEMWYREKCPS